MRRQAILRLKREKRRDYLPPFVLMENLLNRNKTENGEPKAKAEFEVFPVVNPHVITGQYLNVGLGSRKFYQGKKIGGEDGNDLWESATVVIPATLEEEKGQFYLRFTVEADTAHEDCVISFREDDPALVTLDIDGQFPSAWAFEENRSMVGWVPAPEDTMEECIIRTHELRNNLTAEGGTLYIDYTRISETLPDRGRITVEVRVL